jgi:hypothetical protein
MTGDAASAILHRADAPTRFVTESARPVGARGKLDTCEDIDACMGS